MSLDAQPPVLPETRAEVRAPYLLLLAGLTACGPLALSIYIPSLPDVARDLGADGGLAQVTVSAYFFTLALGQLVIGPLSDRFGRRPVALWALSGFVVASVLAAFAATIGQLIALRIVQAFAGASGMVLSRSIIKDVYPSHAISSQIARVVSISVIVPMAAPVIGGALAELFGWRATLLAIALVAAAVLAGSAFGLQETLREREAVLHPGRVLRTYLSFIRDRRFLLMSLSATLFGTANFSFVTGMPFVLAHEYGLGAATFGLWATILSTSYMIGNRITVRLGHRLSHWDKLGLGTVLSTLAVAAMIVTASLIRLPPWAPFVFMAVVGLGHGIGMSNAIALALRSVTANAGTAVALIGALQMFGNSAGSTLVSLIGNGTLGRVLIVLGLVQGLAMVVFFAERPRVRPA